MRLWLNRWWWLWRVVGDDGDVIGDWEPAFQKCRWFVLVIEFDLDDGVDDKTLSDDTDGKRYTLFESFTAAWNKNQKYFQYKTPGIYWIYYDLLYIDQKPKQNTESENI